MYIYFDNAATTMVCEEAALVAHNMMCENYGNPSSLHKMGLISEKELEKSRDIISKILGISSNTIFFTSGGTEGNNLAILGAVQSFGKRGNTIITNYSEHPSVANPCKKLIEKGFNVLYSPIKNNGEIDIEKFEKLLTDDVILVSIMSVNNETGVIQPTNKIGEIVKEKCRNALFHTDMVQAFCKLDNKISKNVDIATISAHKIHATKGVGAIYIKKGVNLSPIFSGGGQEQNIRPGTENVPGIVAFGVASDIAYSNLENNFKHINDLNEMLVNGITANIDDTYLNGNLSVPNIVNISFKGIKSEVLLHVLEANGIIVSSGSACSSNKPMPSPTLKAMGIADDLIDGAIRFSFSRYNTKEEVNKCLEILKREVSILRKFTRR